MKKTLIALAVAASAVVSGSAVAATWEANGLGGSVNLGGTLTPVDRQTPWEVKVGDGATGLDATILKGQSEVSVTPNNAILVLGIRTTAATVFTGGTGMTPQVNFGTAVDVDNFKQGYAPLTLDVKDANQKTIGSLSTNILTGGELSWKTSTSSDKENLFATKAGDAFWGGVGKTSDSIADNAWDAVELIDADIVANYLAQDVTSAPTKTNGNFSSASASYSGFYGAGIKSGEAMKITLASPAQGDDKIVWSATLPVTVSYQ